MSCFDPRYLEGVIDPDTGYIKYNYKGHAKYENPLVFGSIDDLSTKGIYRVLVPCGRCLGCHIDYSREWANRMIVELQDNPNAIFVTLTYNNAHLKYGPSGNPTLDVRDTQLFMKRLRKAYFDKRIRYYLAGEYGPTTLRPHYHAIIYGLSMVDFDDLRVVGKNELGQPYYSSPKFESIWSNGFVQLSPVSYRTCAYVSRYVLKKHYSDDRDFTKRQVKPEFNVSSRKPGIGMLHATDMVMSGNTFFSIPCSDGVRQVYIPKAFIRHTKNDLINAGKSIDFISELVYNRSKQAISRLETSLLYSEQTYLEYLQSQEAKLAGKLKLLPERR